MSTTLAVLFTVGVTVLAVLVALCCGALLEVFRQLESIRVITNLDDHAIPLELRGHGTATASFGFPVPLEDVPEAILVFLSGKCSTCRTIATAFKSGAPANVWFVLEVDNEASRQTLMQLLLSSAERVIWDRESQFADTIGLDVMPSVISVEYGRLARAYGVSSVKQVLDLVPAALPAQTMRPHSIRPSSSADGAVALNR
jgi:hypothetical protein